MIDGWRIKDFAPGAGLTAGAASGTGEGWIAAAAPGDTYLALVAAGRLSHPYVGRGEAEAAWVRDREWWWCAPVTLPDGASDIVFDGLDTFADVYLGGALLGRADNMFRTWRFDLSDLPAGEHVLAVCFHPAIPMTGTAPLPVWSGFTDRISRSRRTAMRKAQFGWGWDWGPDLPTVGIWQPVRLEPRTEVAIRSVNFTTTAIADNTAQVRVDVDLSAPAEVTVELRDPAGDVVAAARGTGPFALTVANPELWWTGDLGAQPLYALTARVDGAPEYRVHVGIRTIAIDESPDPDEPGTTFFRFVVNGVPIFAKGANWVPASSFVGAVPDATYRDLLERAAGANMNMMRVWGGGVYEPDIFYRECDRLGLLVWQDFMFACAPYPEDDAAFVANIDAEVREQVARLRHHACLALWCGNNENQALHWFGDVITGEPTPFVGQTLFHETIPAILADLDPATPYRPGSPWGGPTPNSMRAGDVHNWTVWHGIPTVPDAAPVGAFETAPAGVAFTRYEEDLSRFVSEFGLQGAPDIGTLRRWLAQADLALGAQGFDDRIKDVADKASAMMAPVTGLPETIEQWVEFTMLAQAEGLKFGIEHFRRRMPHCAGALIWQHNDCWPCVSWSLIDYDGVAKASWYATRRAFAPVLGSFRRDGDAVELWITNDTLASVRDTATIALQGFDGTSDWREEVAFEVAAQTSQCVWRGRADATADGVVTVRAASIPPNRMLLAAPKDLSLITDAGLTMTCAKIENGLLVTVRAENYALNAHLRTEDPTLRFDENYFDLAADETCEVTVTGTTDPASLTLGCWNRWAKGTTNRLYDDR